MKITVIKQDIYGKETWRYSGSILEQQDDFVILEASFDREDMDIFGMKLCYGDRFIETYYLNRWYNIFEIHDHFDDHLKGWYCNISTPADINNGLLSYRDLALDLLVFPNGTQIILDEAEFLVLDLGPKEKKMAITALNELQKEFSNLA